jgi:hypothetical protein
MILMFFNKFQKARTKYARGLFVQEINMRDIPGFFSLSTPSPPILYCERGLLLC